MSASEELEDRKLYESFVTALEKELGPKDPTVTHAIIGFESGGPPDVHYFRNTPNVQGIFYVTSDLLFFRAQPKNSLGRYELAICVPAEDKWARNLLFKLSRATVQEAFDEGHTADITAWVAAECTIKGLLFTKLVSFEFNQQSFGALLCVGITRAEMDYALAHDSVDLLSRLKAAGVFPVTNLSRASVF
jgi:Suppressor of fused protein (SUFU)